MLVKNLKEGNNGREMKFVRNGDDGLSVTLSAPLSTSALLGMNFWIAALCLLVFSAQKYLCYRDGIPISSLSAHAHRYVCMCAKSLQSCPNLCNLWTVACQAPLSIGFSRQEYWGGLPLPPSGDMFVYMCV